MRHRSILEYARFRWFKAAIAVSIAAAAAYLWHDAPLKPYGGTWLGYALGTIGAVLILWLMWYGVRKRRYASTSGTVQGWLSAHVYLGSALVVVVTLHTGFELGWNVHTLAYVLYLRVPRAMTQNLGDDTLEGILLKLNDIDREMRARAISLPDPLLRLVDRSITGTRLGGAFWRLLTARDASCPTAAAIAAWAGGGRALRDEAARLGNEVYGLLLRKQQLLEQARRDLRHKALLDLWLYFHVPLAFMLLAALVAHVVSVFIYW